MLLSIITLNYKQAELTINYLKSLYAHFSNEFNNNSIEIIIIDNASGDGSVDLLKNYISKEKYKNIFIHKNSENSGFAKGCNYGAKHAGGKYLLFLNNDTIVQDKSILNMVNYLDQHNEITILGGALKGVNGSPQISAGKFYTPFNVLLLLLGFQKFGLTDKNPAKISEVDWVKGALFMIKKEIFEKLGGFDKNIFMYAEDMELCYRAKKAGLKTFFYPYTNITHKDQGSSNRTFAIINIYKNLLYFYKKHRKPFEYLFIKLLLTVKAIILINYGKIFNDSYLISTYEQALKAIR